MLVGIDEKAFNLAIIISNRVLKRVVDKDSKDQGSKGPRIQALIKPIEYKRLNP